MSYYKPRPGIDVEEELEEELTASKARVAELEAAIRAHRDNTRAFDDEANAAADAALYAVLPETQKETKE